MPSPAARLTSATGTYSPSIWQKELPNCSFAISLRPGSCAQPERVETAGASSVAPQPGQLSCVPSLTVPHQRHLYCRPEVCGVAAGAGWTSIAGVCCAVGGRAAEAASRLTGAPQPVQKFAASGIRDPQWMQNIEFSRASYSVW